LQNTDFLSLSRRRGVLSLDTAGEIALYYRIKRGP
jgi:hypothetical protein